MARCVAHVSATKCPAVAGCKPATAGLIKQKFIIRLSPFQGFAARGGIRTVGRRPTLLLGGLAALKGRPHAGVG